MMSEEKFTQDLTADDLADSWGTYEEKWNGTSLDKTTEYSFSLSFGERNQTMTARYTCKGKNKESELNMTFDFDKATREGVKKTVWLKNGSGSFHKTERGKESTQQISGENFIVFILGPRCVFGIDMPHIMLHELNLQKRTLANLEQK